MIDTMLDGVFGSNGAFESSFLNNLYVNETLHLFNQQANSSENSAL